MAEHGHSCYIPVAAGCQLFCKPGGRHRRDKPTQSRGGANPRLPDRWKRVSGLEPLLRSRQPHGSDRGHRRGGGHPWPPCQGPRATQGSFPPVRTRSSRVWPTAGSGAGPSAAGHTGSSTGFLPPWQSGVHRSGDRTSIDHARGNKPAETGRIQLFKPNKKRPSEAGAWNLGPMAYLAEAKSG